MLDDHLLGRWLHLHKLNTHTHTCISSAFSPRVLQSLARYM